MAISLYGLNTLAKKEDKKIHTTVTFTLFAIGMVLLFLALISAIILRYL
jgi:uncharacterized membrane protein